MLIAISSLSPQCSSVTCHYLSRAYSYSQRPVPFLRHSAATSGEKPRRRLTDAVAPPLDAMSNLQSLHLAASQSNDDWGHMHINVHDGLLPGVAPPSDWGAVEPGGPSSATGNSVRAARRKIQRISRACDRCRRKKIRCNGAQPCTCCKTYDEGEWNPLLTNIVVVDLAYPRYAGT